MLRLFCHIMRANEDQVAKKMNERRINGSKGRERKSWLNDIDEILREKKGEAANLKNKSDVWM